MKASNLLIRTLSSVAIVAVVAACLLTSHLAFLGLMLVILYYALKEFYAISIGSLFPVQRIAGILTSVSVLFSAFLCTFRGADSSILVLPLILLLITFVSCIFLKDDARTMLERMPYVFMGILYVAVPLSAAVRITGNGGEFNGRLLFSLFIIIWASDVGAYCIGSMLGQRPGSRKLAPSISPKKSWWGFWGGVVLGTAASVILNLVGWLGFSIIHAVALGVIVSVAGVCGDLFESLWKRHFGVKDSGSIIPGHGGMLDRIDSALIAIPAAAAYLTIFNL